MEYHVMRRFRHVDDVRQMFLKTLTEIRNADVKLRQVK